MVFVFLLSGCRQPPNLVDPEPPQPFKNVQLKVAFAGTIHHPELIQQFARDWSIRTGAKLEFLPISGEETSAADLVIMSSLELPRAVRSGQILPLPDTYRSSLHRYLWNDIPVAIADKIASWDGKAYGLPLFNEGKVLIFRSDLWQQFTDTKKLTGSQPETWEELCDFVEFCNKPGQVWSFPALSKDADDLIHDFHRIAACYDRLVISEGNLGPGPKTPEAVDAFFSFDFSVETGDPRIDQPAFVHAAKILKRLQACRPPMPEEHPEESFRKGTAVACVASLDLLPLLNRSGSPVAGKFQIAPIPGSRLVYQNKMPLRLETVNRIPYLGESTWVGGVTKSCKSPDAAYDFLVEFAHPSASSLEWIASGKWGAGGFRVSHFDSRNRTHWYGYGFDAARTDRLAEIQRQNLGITVANYTLALRLPNRREYFDILGDQLQSALKPEGNPEKSLEEVSKQWLKNKPDKTLYRISLGL